MTCLVDDIKIPEGLGDIIDWHNEVSREQFMIANQLKEDGLYSLHTKWQKSAKAHKECAKLISNMRSK